MSTVTKRSYLKVLAGWACMKHIKKFRAALAALVTVVLTSQSPAADIFVSPAGSGDFSGSSWSNAMNGNEENRLGIKVKTAITDAVAADAEEVNVYFASGEYVTTNQITLSSITIPVKLSGGYVGETDGSFDRSETATIFKKFPDKKLYIRFISATSLSSFIVEGITFTGGYIEASGAKGGALLLTSSNVKIEKCVFNGNSIKNKTNNHYGGGAIAGNTSGTIEIINCIFKGNYLVGANANNMTGGAVYASDIELYVKDSEFNGNYWNSGEQKPWVYGGAIGTYHGLVSIENSIFTNNWLKSYYSSSNYGCGGALAIRNAKKLKLSDCKFFDNYIQNPPSTYVNPAGVIYLDDWRSNNGVMTSVVERCIFDSANVPTSKLSNMQTDIVLNGGRLFMTNCLISRAKGNHAQMTSSIKVQRYSGAKKTDQGYEYKTDVKYYTPINECSLELVNSTIADGSKFGVKAQTEDVEIHLKNCIVSGHSLTGVVNATSIEHCYIQANNDGTWNYEEEGNLNPNQVGDINWTGAPYYHLLTKNANGAITNGWFSGTFESPKTAADSPCIDAGALGSIGLDLEPYYSGRRVNIGAYGGTPWASKTSPLPGFKLIIR